MLSKNNKSIQNFLKDTCLFITIVFATFFGATQVISAQEWTRSGGDNQSTKYSPATQINEANVNTLTKRWVFHSGGAIDKKDTVQTNPIFTGNYVITTSLDGRVIALNPSTGTLIWEVNLPKPVARRGLTFKEGNIFVPTSNGIYVVNELDGKLNLNFGNKGVIGSGLSYLPPAIDGEVIFVASLTTVEAYSIKTGERIWQRSFSKDGVTPRIWSGFSYDKDMSQLYIVTSDPGSIVPGRFKSGGFANSLIAVDGKSGEITWQFREKNMDDRDLDMVGPPMATSINDKKIVLALSKSGNLITVDAITGKSIYKKSQYVRAINENIYTAFFSGNIFNPKVDVTDESHYKKQYVLHKIRNAKSESHAPLNINNDIVLYGLHGGAEWPGGAIDEKQMTAYIPSNKYPWILRMAFQNNSKVDIDAIASKHQTYVKNCSSCHGVNLSGFRSGEEDGDTYFPSLLGETRKRSEKYLRSIDNFRNDHKYANVSYEKFNKLNKYVFEQDKGFFSLLIKKILVLINSPKFTNDVIEHIVSNRLLKYKRPKLDINKISSADLSDVYDLYIEIDGRVERAGGYDVYGFWQPLLDPDGFPGSRPPWGQISAVNFLSGQMVWQRPFGVVVDKSFSRKISGDRNFGGLLVTKSGIIFASGTPDMFARAFSAKDGKELWASELPASGSSPPTAFLHKGCQYIVFTATGGRFVGFNKQSDSTVAYSLDSCSE